MESRVGAEKSPQSGGILLGLFMEGLLVSMLDVTGKLCVIAPCPSPLVACLRTSSCFHPKHLALVSGSPKFSVSGLLH